MFGETEFWTFSNRYEDGVIVSRHSLRKRTGTNRINLPTDRCHKTVPRFSRTDCFVATLPIPNQQIQELFGNIDLSEVLGTDVTVLLVAPELMKPR